MNTEDRLKKAIQLLQSQGVSLEEFAKHCGTYRQNISAFMLGKRCAQIRWIETACTVYGFSPEWMLTGKGEIKSKQN